MAHYLLIHSTRPRSKIIWRVGLIVVMIFLAGCAIAPWQTVHSKRDAKTQEVLERSYVAHGGKVARQNIERIDIVLSTNGLAFLMRRQADKFINKRVSIYPREFKTVIYDFPKKDWVGIWQDDSVTFKAPDESGRQDLKRDAARMHFVTTDAPGNWDDLDAMYFVGYAIWNYFAFPFLLEDERIAVTAKEFGSGETLLDVRFPPGYPTHSQQQYFLLDKDFYLLRHDYTAEVFAGWANAANFTAAPQSVQGMRFYTKRHVRPSLGRLLSLPFPILLTVKVEQIQVY